jgi:hypothetical protein
MAPGLEDQLLIDRETTMTGNQTKTTRNVPNWPRAIGATVIAVAVATWVPGACGDPDAEDDWYSSQGSGCNKRCSSSCKCGVGEGDCDRDSHCKSGLKCPQSASFNPDGHDVCYDPDSGGGGGGRWNCAGANNGSPRECFPLREGEGDCDPGECADGLVCKESGKTDICVRSDGSGGGGGGGGSGSGSGSGRDCAGANNGSPRECFPLRENEGDCDPGECAEGLVCEERGNKDICVKEDGSGGGGVGGGGGGPWDCCDEWTGRKWVNVDGKTIPSSGTGSWNGSSWIDAEGTFVLFDGGRQKGIRCTSAERNKPPKIVSTPVTWTVSRRRMLKDKSGGLYLMCPENKSGQGSCWCREGSGEWFHSYSPEAKKGGGPVHRSLLATDEGVPIYPDADGSYKSYCLMVKNGTLENTRQDRSPGCAGFTFKNWKNR